ncbi:MAG: LL-diaminopimelate aminotransferase [Oscillospiraceae bacterium]|jgi:LL-diaminopimelate aminotransferase|nr:LL-diaminopimelate aminotransferase [Oscillospiraceae bacterium]
MKINENFLKLQSSYLFSTIGKKVGEYSAANPKAQIIRLGIGDVTRPLPSEVIDSLHKAADEMANEETFRGYPPEQGNDFLISSIKEYDYKLRDVNIDEDEIFISDGAKSDTGNIGDIFSQDNAVAVCDPIYPVYVDTNVMAGRSGELTNEGKWSKFIYLDCNQENDFFPGIPKEKADLIYLCFPNNPTGMAADKAYLKKWVDYANENSSVILYDAAYEGFITQDNIPHSIYEVQGAKTCAIEFRSFSKTAGFTGVRCAYTIVPKELKCGDVSLNSLWARRQATKFNGVSYITQRAAQAVYSEKGRAQVMGNIAYYQNNAKVISEGLKEAGFKVWGAVNSPYVWFKVPQKMTSWDFFDLMLEKTQVVGTPGSGFGPAGEGYFRLTGFGSSAKTLEAVDRIKNARF